MRPPSDPRPPNRGRVVVVVPSLDEAEALPRLLGRLMGERGRPEAEAQDPADLVDRVVVADGGSTDGTQAAARRAGVEVIEASPGRGSQLAAGATEALQVGLDEADLLLFLHADNLPEPGALAALREAAVAHPGAVAFGLSQRVDSPGRFFRMIERAADRRTARGLVYGDSGLAVRAAAYRAVGGYRPLPLFEDLDLSRRLAALGEVRLVTAARIRVNARRWKTEGALRTTLRNWILTLAWRLGAPPARLVAWYPRHGR